MGSLDKQPLSPFKNYYFLIVCVKVLSVYIYVHHTCTYCLNSEEDIVAAGTGVS